MTLQTALEQGTKLLQNGAISAPRLTAEVLLGHAMHRDRAYFYAHPEQELREVEWIHYGRYLHERLGHKPTQYITQQQEFYGRRFRVTPAVLIPRPETELLVERALARARRANGIVDVGTGSGAIAISLALETGQPVVATDVSPEALAVARENARALGARAVGARVGFLLADGLSAFAPRSVDLVVSNPPYVAEADRETLQPEVRDYEPALALFAGPDGLNFYRRLIPEAARTLRPAGDLWMEIGYGQADAVIALFAPDDWRNPEVYPDLAGIPRVVHAEKKR